MWMLGPVGFTAPWLLLGLIGLPILWFLLRAVPPAPIRRRFPGVVLLLGLRDEDAQIDLHGEGPRKGCPIQPIAAR